MLTRVTIKRLVKRASGWGALLENLLRPESAANHACLFAYHRVANIPFVDRRCDDWNVSPQLLERQISAMVDAVDIVPLEEACSAFHRRAAANKAVACLTFDDGYANFCTEVLPILERYGVPATVFVVTNTIGSKEPPPFDRWSRRNKHRVAPDAWQVMDWDQLETCLATGLVSVGSHSHYHRKGSDCSTEQLREETETSHAILKSRLGEPHCRMYSYPYGSSRAGEVTSTYVDAVQNAGYRLAVTTDLGLASASSDQLLLPRIEAHGVDTPAVTRAKACGSVRTYRLADQFRSGLPSMQ